jgi:hypothetical protein
MVESLPFQLVFYGEGLVQLTSLYSLVLYQLIFNENILYLHYITSTLNRSHMVEKLPFKLVFPGEGLVHLTSLY